MKTKLIRNWASLLGVAFTTQLHADLLNPTNFASLGTFDVTNGAYVIDTDALTISGTNGVLFTGVMDNQGGQADSFGPGTSVTNVGPLGIPYIAVFTFDDLALDGTATFTVTGHRALALLSQGDALINVALSLNGKAGGGLDGLAGGTVFLPGGAGGAGGFAGGSAGGYYPSPGTPYQQPQYHKPGDGPGGGPGFYESNFSVNYAAASGSFGSVGLMDSSNQTGVAYGDLTGVLQGGSGGGGDLASLSPEWLVYPGSGGGGALEIVAVGLLNIASAAKLQADGGRDYTYGYADFGGAGSGGGIRLGGRSLVVSGSVAADSQGWGGGGRILLRGLAARYQAGFDIGSVVPAGVSVRCLSNNLVPPYTLTNNITITNRVLQGHVHLEFGTFDISAGTSYELGQVAMSQAATTNQPAVDLSGTSDLTVEGTLTVPAGGIAYSHSIELRGLAAKITGADPLALTGPLSGEGSVQAPLAVLTGGSISVGTGQELAFTQPVTNVAGTFINDIGGTLTFAGDGNGATDDGLLNHGSLNLINAVVNGDVHSPSNSTVNVAGTATFNGLFKGGAGFSGTQNLVTFNGGYEPGDSPAAVSFGGSVAFGSGNTLTMELAGTNAGAQYDQLNIGDTATFGGTLDVVLIDGFVPAAGRVFHLINAGARLGSFATISLPDLPGGLEWQNSLAADGTITVIAPGGSGPQFSSVVLSGLGLIFAGTGGVTNGSYVLLSSTNLATPLINWIPVSTNPFDASGNFLLTNTINPARPREFYRLELQ